MFHHESITSTGTGTQCSGQLGNASFLYFWAGEKGGSTACFMWIVDYWNWNTYQRFDLLLFFLKKCANTGIMHQVKTTKSKAFKVCNKMPSYCGVKIQEAADDSPSSMQQGKLRVSAGYAIASVNCLDFAFIIKKRKKKIKNKNNNLMMTASFYKHKVLVNIFDGFSFYL